MASPNPHAPKASASADQGSEGSMQNTTDMTAFVQNSLMQLQSRMQTMSESIVAKIDEMGSKIDELEKNINNIKAEMDEAESAGKTNPAEDKPFDE